MYSISNSLIDKWLLDTTIYKISAYGHTHYHMKASNLMSHSDLLWLPNNASLFVNIILSLIKSYAVPYDK